MYLVKILVENLIALIFLGKHFDSHQLNKELVEIAVFSRKQLVH
jgi:hypothetical protein